MPSIRIFTLAAALGLLAALPAPASAADSLSCQLDGVMRFTSGGVGVSAGSANYRIDATTTCAYTGGGAPAVDHGRLASYGHVNNTTCSTGWGFGSTYLGETVMDFPPGSPVPDIVDMKYLYLSAGGQATVDITRALAADGRWGQGAGELTLVPSAGDCLNTPITTYDVVGHFDVTLFDPAIIV